MTGRLQLVLIGIGALLIGCNGASRDVATEGGKDESASPAAIKPPPTMDATAKKFSEPVVRQAAAPPQVVPGLLQATNAQARVPAIAKGRRDPFAPLNPGAIKNPNPVVATPPTPPRPNSINPWAGSTLRPGATPLPPLTMLPPLPGGSTVGVGAFPNGNGPSALPVPGNSALPPLSIPIAPPSRTALADAVQVTGVVQVRGKWHVIVKESDADSSRYVAVGDRLAGGRVLVKRIINQQGIDPSVVLQQDGIEVVKPIGAPVGPLATLP